MSDQHDDAFEVRARALFHDSVDAVDMRIRSRLTQARSAALEAAGSRRPWLLGWKMWTPAAGVSAAAILGVALWLGSPLGHQTAMFVEAQTSLEDLELVAATDESSGDAIEMLQDDIDFYDFADKAATSGPAV